MSSFIRGTDPLALLAIQAGQTPTPSEQSGAEGNNPLDVQQAAHVIGDPVPIVFGRRRNGTGGVFISPKATECRFENDTNNAVTAYYHLVLSEGQIGQLQVRDVFQRQCRVGTAAQTYDRRAGSWEPANVIQLREGFDKPEATYHCGSVGRYRGISTLSFEVTIPDGFDVWNRQVHVFVRQGMKVRRWLNNLDDVSSDSFADLAYWLMDKSARIPLPLIDTDSITDASRFLNVNDITTNCWIRESINYSDLLSRWGRYHLLRPATVNGRQGLRPLLPVNSNGTIKTTALTVEYVFDDDLAIPGSVDIRYSDWSSSQPFVAQMIWRQEFEDCLGIMRTAEVRYQGTAENGPYESHDLSAFCTREDHAVKVGAYILSKRVRSTHTIRFKVRPQAHNTLLQQGSIVRVRLERNPFGGAAAFHDYIYQVERITKTLAGDVGYECSHMPVDSQLRSLIALDVVNAQGTGYLYDCNTTGLGCDLNSPEDDDEIPDDDWTIPDPDPGGEITPIDPDVPIDIGGGGGSVPGDGGEDGLPEPDPNPDDEVDGYEAGIYFHSATWDANVLTVRMRLAPTGKAPRQDLGPLFASIASTSVVALLPNGQPASPQPQNLPTVSFSGLIAQPWNATTEGLPMPPADRVFEGVFQIPYPGSAFPPAAEDPTQQLTYRATVEFNDFVGGFTEVDALNTLTVDFVPTEGPEIEGAFDWYLVEYFWNGGIDLDTRTSVITPGVLRSEDAGYYVGYDAGDFLMKEELLNSSGQPVVQWAGDELGQGPEVEHALITSANLPDVSSVQFRLAAQWYMLAFGSIQARVYGVNGGSWSIVDEAWVNTGSTKYQLLALKQVSIPTNTFIEDENNGADFIGYDVATLTIDLEAGAASLS
jgi:hypothetical protein